LRLLRNADEQPALHRERCVLPAVIRAAKKIVARAARGSQIFDQRALIEAT
jgi:hypothetical protein